MPSSGLVEDHAESGPDGLRVAAPISGRRLGLGVAGARMQDPAIAWSARTARWFGYGGGLDRKRRLLSLEERCCQSEKLRPAEAGLSGRVLEPAR
jgi:hypothetical protein